MKKEQLHQAARLDKGIERLKSSIRDLKRYEESGRLALLSDSFHKEPIFIPKTLRDGIYQLVLQSLNRDLQDLQEEFENL